jgi:subtilisin family serine protease
MSLAGSVSTTLNQAVQNAINAGVTFVVSAGNYSSDACNYSPASVQAAITVGASTGQDTQATFSNFGKCVDIYAPGVSILSTAFNSDTATAYLSGTSMSAPHVAGVASLYLAANPSASPLDVAIALTSNATANALTGVGPGSPNLLLYAGFIGSAPPAPSPAPPSPDSPPTASFTYSCARARCTFDAGGSSDDNGIISYSWSFGDGTSATSASGVVSVTHTYSSTGIYSVTLTVIDTARQLSSSTVSIKIRKI